ncbi:hypothetical protein CesoFtcFv8_008303 [Champsocephalus esox]|uniref:Uncharacterized protein n=1 Tax=Champsocephalus esox TaxID=159716 RepID=A0AAN8CAA9_9TELE|nr:hypothetical protein CesoFtcFv8_008303 [Champsocephalus esox]
MHPVLQAFSLCKHKENRRYLAKLLRHRTREDTTGGRGDTESPGHDKRSSVCEGNEQRQCEVVKESGDGGRWKGKGNYELWLEKKSPRGLLNRCPIDDI